jgi:hypothetical protein
VSRLEEVEAGRSCLKKEENKGVGRSYKYGTRLSGTTTTGGIRIVCHFGTRQQDTTFEITDKIAVLVVELVEVAVSSRSNKQARTTMIGPTAW